MSEEDLYRIKTCLFDTRIELACNHAKLYSILKNFIFLSPLRHRESRRINIKINLVKDINFPSLSSDNKWILTFEAYPVKCFYDKKYNYYYYTDFKSHIITLESKSQMKIEICKKLLKYAESADFIRYLIVFPALVTILKCNNIFHLHAAALERKKIGYLFPGHSRSGKTTLSLALIKKGYRLLSDDMVFIKYPDNSLKVGIIINRDIRIKKRTDLIFPIIADAKTKLLAQPYRNLIMLNPAAIWPGQGIDRIHLHKIIFPKITKRGKTSIAAISKRQAFYLLMKSKTLSGYGQDRLIEKHINCLKKISSFKERYILFLGRDALTSPETIPRILDSLKKE